MLFDIHDSNNALNLITYWLMTDGLRTDGLCLGLMGFVKDWLLDFFMKHLKVILRLTILKNN